MLELKKGELSDVQCAEMLADLYATIDVANDVFRVNEQSASTPNTLHKDSDPDEGLVALDQKARYLERRSRVASVMGDAKLSDETLAELESVAPAAATFLIAKRRAEYVDMNEPPFDDIFDLRDIVSGLNEQAGTDARNRERFLEAVLCWLLKDTNRAVEIWRSLSHDYRI